MNNLITIDSASVMLIITFNSLFLLVFLIFKLKNKIWNE
jgi:hypothetical protein